MYKLVFAILMPLILVLSGCTSITSTFLHRDETNQSWSKVRRLRGAPVTVRVPTHVRVDINEMHYYVKCDEKGLERIKLCNPVRSMKYSYVYDEKVFTVDLKRPGSGTSDSTFNFVDQANQKDAQYISSLNTTVVDNTIKDASALINTIGMKLIGPVKTADKMSTDQMTKVKTFESLVATEIFALDDPEFEAQMEGFLHLHLNCCSNCGTPASAPDCKDCGTHHDDDLCNYVAPVMD